MKKVILSLVAAGIFANAEMLKIEGGMTLDTDTKLIWQDNLEAKTVEKNWQGAMDYCENLTLANFDDWKLPDIDTLKALYPKKDSLQNVYTNEMSASGYWSSSTVDGAWVDGAWVVGFADGAIANTVSIGNTWYVFHYNGADNSDDVKWHSAYVRCVRDSKNFDTLSFSSFLNALKANFTTKKSIVLSSKPSFSISEPKLFLVKKDDKNYFGIQSELLKQFRGNQEQSFSKNPFETIQKLTQKGLNDYFTIAAIDIPVVIKDEFETKAEFQTRLSLEQEKYRTKVEARNAELEKRKANIEVKKKEYLFDSFAWVMGNPKLSNPTFDAETNTMFVDVAMSNAAWSKNIAIKIEDRNLAKNFKNALDKTNAKVAFEYEKDGFVLKNIDVEFENKNLVATLNAKDYKPEIVSVALQQVSHLQNPNLIVPNIAYNESNQAKGIKYNDDLTSMVKKATAVKEDPKKWLFALAIEKYDEADAVSFAKNSAEAFISATQKRFGVSARNTYALIDEKATSGSIKDKLELMLSNVKDGDTVYFYYSGHGIPNPNDGEAYILPKDKVVDFVTREKEFMVRNIYKQLSDSKASKIVAFMDSCFSGSTDGVSNIKGTAAGIFKTKKVEFDKSKMVVLTAGTSNQFSNAFFEKGHRLFSYYLTKAIIERPTLDIDSIYKEVAVRVKDESFKMGDMKKQEPQIEGNAGIGL